MFNQTYNTIDAFIEEHSEQIDFHAKEVMTDIKNKVNQIGLLMKIVEDFEIQEFVPAISALMVQEPTQDTLIEKNLRAVFNKALSYHVACKLELEDDIKIARQLATLKESKKYYAKVFKE